MPFSEVLRGPDTVLSIEQAASELLLLLFPIKALTKIYWQTGKRVHLSGCSKEGISLAPPSSASSGSPVSAGGWLEMRMETFYCSIENHRNIPKAANVSLKKSLLRARNEGCGHHIYFLSSAAPTPNPRVYG